MSTAGAPLHPRHYNVVCGYEQPHAAAAAFGCKANAVEQEQTSKMPISSMGLLPLQAFQKADMWAFASSKLLLMMMHCCLFHQSTFSSCSILRSWLNFSLDVPGCLVEVWSVQQGRFGTSGRVLAGLNEHAPVALHHMEDGLTEKVTV